MTPHDDTIRLRGFPAAAHKVEPPARWTWPDGAVVFHSILDDKGSLTLGCALELYGDWAFRESLITPGLKVPDEIRDYCVGHRANVLLGTYRELRPLPLGRVQIDGRTSGFGYELRRRGYRAGWAIVAANLSRQLLGVADHWSESRKTPGDWSICLVGLGEWLDDLGVPRYRKFPDAPRIRLKAVGDHVLASWASTTKDDNLDEAGAERRPVNRRGPFVDVLGAGSGLAGGPVTSVAQLRRLFGVSLLVPEDPIERLRAETLAISQIYLRQRALVAELGLGIDLSNLVSTGGIATALLREMEPGP